MLLLSLLLLLLLLLHYTTQLILVQYRVGQYRIGIGSLSGLMAWLPALADLSSAAGRLVLGDAGVYYDVTLCSYMCVYVCVYIYIYMHIQYYIYIYIIHISFDSTRRQPTCELPAWADRYLTSHHLELEDSCSVLIRSRLNLAPWPTFAHEGPRPANSMI